MHFFFPLGEREEQVEIISFMTPEAWKALSRPARSQAHLVGGAHLAGGVHLAGGAHLAETQSEEDLSWLQTHETPRHRN